MVRHGPVKACQLQQARYHPKRLPQRRHEQDLNSQTELDSCIEVRLKPIWMAALPSGLFLLSMKPHKQ
jgi:hypothetical protein